MTAHGTDEALERHEGMKMMVKNEAVKNHRAGQSRKQKHDQGGVGEHSVIVMLLSSESRNQPSS